MNLIERGSNPINFAATASIATWSELARMTFLTCGVMQRGPRSVAGERTVHHRKQPAVNLLLDHQQVDQGLVDDGVGPVSVFVEQPPEGILHRSGRRREDVSLDSSADG